ncbi:MAG TPA: carotenoid 1,2-hydratase, partial [Myxococcaceae bacterium]|nr:carotenoid 1,2-hydratase [Myxococcaceae bacterium]
MNACAPLLAVVFTFLALGCSREETVPQATLTVAGALGSGGTEGFARATEVRAFRFPEDHGPHPEFRTEWWYFTGNLNTEEGRRLGYQFTLFRNALVPKATARPSRWAASQFYMGHFAVSDVGGERFYAFDRFSREALGLAGAQGAPFRVWL